MRQPVIGFGTGRCGTMSLAKIINACRNTNVRHEHHTFRVDWYDPKLRKIRRMIRSFKSNGKRGILAGDIALYWLPHVEYIRKQLKDIKLICMHRNKKETVQSFLNKSNVADRLRPNKKTGQRIILGDNMFPTLDGYDIKQSLSFYWEMYEKWSRSIKDIYHMDVYQLNDKKVLISLFDYLEIPEKDRVFPSKTRYNEGPQ